MGCPMAKCFQVVGQGVPVRMSDEDAFQIVDRDKDGQYCSKKLWREWYAPIPPADRTGLAKLVGTKITRVDSLARNLQFKRMKKRA